MLIKRIAAAEVGVVVAVANNDILAARFRLPFWFNVPMALVAVAPDKSIAADGLMVMVPAGISTPLATVRVPKLELIAPLPVTALLVVNVLLPKEATVPLLLSVLDWKVEPPESSRMPLLVKSPLLAVALNTRPSWMRNEPLLVASVVSMEVAPT